MIDQLRAKSPVGKSKEPTHCFHCGAELPTPQHPTKSPRNSNERIRVMMARAERGLPVKHPQDIANVA